MGKSGVAVVIPVHNARAANGMLNRALLSVIHQTAQPEQLVLEFDHDGRGSTATRNAALLKVDTPWVAFLDSDDWLYEWHLSQLLKRARETGADLVYSRFASEAERGADPVPIPHPWAEWFGPASVPDPAALRARRYNIPITVLARTDALIDVGGFVSDLSIAPPATCDDWATWVKLLDNGAVFDYLPVMTWAWVRHGGNTSGSPRLGDAK